MERTNGENELALTDGGAQGDVLLGSGGDLLGRHVDRFELSVVGLRKMNLEEKQVGTSQDQCQTSSALPADSLGGERGAKNFPVGAPKSPKVGPTESLTLRSSIPHLLLHDFFFLPTPIDNFFDHRQPSIHPAATMPATYVLPP
jgi:hypothetical protein